MGVERVRALWREGQTVTSAWLSTPDGLIAEALARAGFDLLVLDMQHGMAIGPERAAAWLQVVQGAGVAALVRVPWNDPVHIQYVLDAGADGIIAPLVASPADATKAVGACRYPPLGYRSYGPNRARLLGQPDYYTWANENVLCIALIEHVAAVEQIEAIAATPGLDGLFVGPTDLGLSIGLRPGERDPRHWELCKRVAEVGRARGLILGFWSGGDLAEIRKYQEIGFNFLPLVNDVALVRAGAEAAIRQFLER
jgi:4-hydroxy-2-oxoheptanedioate aldolase